MTSLDEFAERQGPHPEANLPLKKLTTMRVGGPAERILIGSDAAEIADLARELWDEDEPWLLLGGGSNTVVSDEGFPGTVLLVRSSGVEIIEPDGANNNSAINNSATNNSATNDDATGAAALPAGAVRIRVQAGHDWDALVAECVERGYAGIEALSGIPGLAGAAPVQNIGAYGAELSSVLHSIEFLERYSGEVLRLNAGDLALGYRDSAIKQGLEGVVLSIDLVLQSGERRGRHGGGAGPVLSAPIAYDQLARALDVQLGDRVPISDVRDAVLELRAAKGMVLNESDHDTWSAGSFFTNPIVSESFARTLPEGTPRFPVTDDESSPVVTSFEDLAAGVPLTLPNYAREGRVKLSAAWLIEQSGVPRGFRLPGSGAAISSKHTLAITNRGNATAAEVAEIARFVIQRVQQEFGVVLVPEPNLYGLEL